MAWHLIKFSQVLGIQLFNYLIYLDYVPESLKGLSKPCSDVSFHTVQHSSVLICFIWIFSKMFTCNRAVYIGFWGIIFLGHLYISGLEESANPVVLSSRVFWAILHKWWPKTDVSALTNIFHGWCFWLGTDVFYHPIQPWLRK